jgi:hypothetical protein
MANSPTQRKRAQTNPRAPPTINGKSLGFRPPMLEITWLSLGFRWKMGREEPRLPFYSIKLSFSGRISWIRRRWDSMMEFVSVTTGGRKNAADRRAWLVSDRKERERRAATVPGPAHTRGKGKWAAASASSSQEQEEAKQADPSGPSGRQVRR